MKYRIVERKGYFSTGALVTNGLQTATVQRSGHFFGYVAQRSGLGWFWEDIDKTIYSDIQDAKRVIKIDESPVVYEHKKPESLPASKKAATP